MSFAMREEGKGTSSPAWIGHRKISMPGEQILFQSSSPSLQTLWHLH